VAVTLGTRDSNTEDTVTASAGQGWWLPIRVLPPRLAGAPMRVDPKAEDPPDPKRARVAAASAAQNVSSS